MAELRVPFAVDSAGKVFSPTTAQKDELYFCPACRASVILKKGEVRQIHFAHKASDVCNQETITHKTAKLLIQNAVREWKLGISPVPTLQRECQICNETIEQALPDKVEDAVLEQRLEDGSIADVVLVGGNSTLAAVEIRVTHSVDEEKALRLPIPFIELDGYEVITNPVHWKPITDYFKPISCAKCKSAYPRFQAKVKQIAKANNIELPSIYYRYGFCKCWKCKREIIVFAWPEDEDKNPVDAIPKAIPVPKSIQYRYSKTANQKYWVNVCLYCQSIQGKFYLHMEPDGPFFAINPDDNSPTSFDRDMLRVAAHAVSLGWV